MAYESQTVNKLSSGRDTMKKKIIKTISGAMAAAIILSGCNSAQLKFDSEDEEAVEDSGEADSENESDEESTKLKMKKRKLKNPMPIHLLMHLMSLLMQMKKAIQQRKTTITILKRKPMKVNLKISLTTTLL